MAQIMPAPVSSTGVQPLPEPKSPATAYNIPIVPNFAALCWEEHA